MSAGDGDAIMTREKAVAASHTYAHSFDTHEIYVTCCSASLYIYIYIYIYNMYTYAVSFARADSIIAAIMSS